MGNQPLSYFPHQGLHDLPVRIHPAEPIAETSFSAPRQTAQLLDTFFQATPNLATPGPLVSAFQDGRARNLSEALAQLNPSDRATLRQRLGRSMDELESLSQERDFQIFYHGLLQVGQRLEDNDQIEQAGVVYSTLVAGGPHPYPSPPRGEGHTISSTSLPSTEGSANGMVSPSPLGGEGGRLGRTGEGLVPTSIRDRAQVRLNAMTGVGASGERIAFLARRISTEATRPDMLLAMGAAGAAFHLTRLAATARLAGTMESAWGLRAAAYSSGFLAETVAFTGVGKVAGQAIGYHQDWNPEAVFHEWAGGATMLLGLKVTGALAGAATQRYARGTGALERFTQVALPQLGMFGGIMLGNRLAEAGGFHPHREGDTWFVDGLSTLLQFNVAGRLQGAVLGPRFAQFEQRIDAHTEMLSRPSARASEGGGLADSLQSFLTPDLVTPEGFRMPVSEARDPLSETAVFSVRHEGGESTPPPPNGGSVPPASNNSSGPPRPPTRAEEAAKRWGERLNNWTDALAKRDLNRYQDPNGPLGELRRARQPAPVESLEQGVLLAVRGNAGQRQVWHSRRVLDQTRDLPRTREAYLQTETARMEFQRGVRERLDPILQKMEMPNYGSLSEATAVYEQSVRDILGSGHSPFEADALLNLYQARRILDPTLRQSLTPADLTRMGLEPKALEWIQNHPDAFLPGAIEVMFRTNPQLAAAPGAEGVLTSAREMDQQNPSIRAAVRNGRVFRNFVSDPNVAPLWLSEVALQASTREMLRRNPEGFLQEVLEQGKPEHLDFDAIPEFARRIENFREAAQRLKSEQVRPQVRGITRRIASWFGVRDYQPLHRAMGNYMKATLDLLAHHENDILPQAIRVLNKRLSALTPENIAALNGARGNLMDRYQEAGATQRANFLELEPQIREFFRYYDTAIEPLREQGTRVGLTHVEELLEKVRDSIGAERYEQEIAPRFGEIKEQYEAALEEYHVKAAEAREGRFNPRDFNRKIEKQLELVCKNAYQLVLDSARKNGVDLGEVRRILPFYETYAHKYDLPQELTKWEHRRRIARYALPALEGVTRFKSALRRDYAFSAVARVFQNFGSNINRNANPQTFFYDPALENVLDHFHYAISADHNTHLDFIGHAGNVVQAILGNRALSHSIPDILAKFDLSIPLIEDVFPFITNLIPNDLPGVRRAEIRASHMQAFGSLPHSRIHPTMPLGYDNITMDVTNGEGPYTRDPHAPTTGSLPVMGRLFGVSEAATVITGRPQGIVFAQDPGAIRNYPSQRGTPVLLNNPSSMVTQFFPMTALPETIRGEKVTARNNIERLIWYLQGFHPEADPEAPQTDAVYRDYQRPLDPATEQAVASLFNGAWELYPTAEGISRLEVQAREARARIESSQRAKQGEETSRALRDYDLVQQVLDIQTRQLLRNELTVFDQRLATELGERPDSAEAKGLRRMQRILRSRLKLMGQVERKIANREALSLTERRFVEKAGAAIAGRDNVSGTDRILEQLNHYFAMRDVGVSLETRLLQSQRQYYEFVRQWNEARKDPDRPEYHQIHVSEAPGYQDSWNDYRIAIEALYNLHGITPNGWSGSRLRPVMEPIYHLFGLNPNGWEGEVFPDMTFRREGGSLIVEPRDWKSHEEIHPFHRFSRTRLWKFLLNDTMGIVQLATHAKDYDPSPFLFSTLHRGWGHRAMTRTHTRLHLTNIDRLRDVANTPLIVGPTHDSANEFPVIPSILHDYGIQAFFLADRKFFDTGFHPPTFGLLPRLLGNMAQYGQFEIDRSNRELALESMRLVGTEVAATGKSAIVFPGGTRNPVRYRAPRTAWERFLSFFHIRNRLRYEGPIYGSKAGIGLSMEGSGVTVLPLGMVNGGVIFPKQAGDAFIFGGAAVGREYEIHVGDPIYYDRLIPGNPAPRGGKLRTALTGQIDGQFRELTGREIASPAESKAKKIRKPN